MAIVENTVKTRTIVNGTGISENRTFYFATKDLLDKKPEVVNLFAKQSEWHEIDSDSIKKMLTEAYGLKEEPDNIERGLKIIAEAVKRNVIMAPTVFINGKEFQFPVELDASQLKAEVDKALIAP